MIKHNCGLWVRTRLIRIHCLGGVAALNLVAVLSRTLIEVSVLYSACPDSGMMA
jgi:hypothetical protein